MESANNQQHPDSIAEADQAGLADGVRTLRMTLAYEGTNYCGWQIQPNGIALQKAVEDAMSAFTGQPTKVTASGRTDAGVHAVGQVISFQTRSTAPCAGFLHGLAQYLPEDVVVRDVVEAAAGFNARYDAKQKWYRYVIHNSPIRIPHLRNLVLWQRTRLDHQAMHEAVQCLIGTHDFRCFETKWPNRSSSVRTVVEASVTRIPGWDAWQSKDDAGTRSGVMNHDDTGSDPTGLNCEPQFICFDIKADGFLYNMVRAIVGSLIHVGRGRWSPAELLRILENGDRTQAGETAPPQGLYLMRVDY